MQTNDPVHRVNYIRWLIAIGLCFFAILWLNRGTSHAPSTESYPMTTSEDTFVYAGDPNANYGSAGALAITGDGPSSNEEISKSFETFIQFSAKQIATHFDQTMGSDNWKLEHLILKLDWAFAVGDKPGNELFRSPISNAPRIEVSWVNDSNWTQGTGRPRDPTYPEAAANGLTWNNSRSLADTSQSVAKKTLEYPSTEVELALIDEIRSALVAGRNLTFRLSPSTPETNVLIVSSQKGLGGNGAVLEVRASRKQEHE